MNILKLGRRINNEKTNCGVFVSGVCKCGYGK